MHLFCIDLTRLLQISVKTLLQMVYASYGAYSDLD